MFLRIQKLYIKNEKKNWWDIPPATNKQQTKLDTIVKIYSLPLSS